mgnify:FL=1
MLNFIRIAWAAIMAVYGYFFVKDYRQISLAGKLDDVSVPKAGFVGFITKQEING